MYPADISRGHHLIRNGLTKSMTSPNNLSYLLDAKLWPTTPVENQSKLSDNATQNYYVGPAPDTKLGILFFNPKTKLAVIRQSFQPLNHHDLTIPYLPIYAKQYSRLFNGEQFT